jgi:polysaccharide biosynthesis/export protein
MRLFLTLLLTIVALRADTKRPESTEPVESTKNNDPTATTSRRTDPRYVLGPEDQITIWGLDIEEISGRPVHLDAGGNINLPLIGRFHAAGMTVPQLEQELTERLSKYVKQPQIVVGVGEYRSQPVSVLGAVTNPGSHQLKGDKTVAEVLALAGGLKPEAGTWVKLTRRHDQGPIPHPSASMDPSGAFSYANLNLSSITDAKSQGDNIVVRPHDILTVPRADMVYVVGDVVRAGGFVLNERESMSVLQAVSMAGGLGPTAASGKAKILRAQKPGSPRQEIAVDIAKVLSGKRPDVKMAAEDILVIPSSKMKKVSARGIEAAVQALTGMLIWGAN